MTNNNKKITSTANKVVVFSILSATIVLATTSNSNVWAMHDTIQSWTEPDQEYFCKSNLSSLDVTSNVIPCSNLSSAAGTWNAVANSDWNLTRSFSHGIDVGSANLADDGPLATTWTLGIPILFTAWIDVNTEYPLGDASTSDSGIYDYKSLMTHEFGHLLKVVHNTSTSSTMYESLPADTLRRSLNSHDQSVVAGKY